MCRLRPSAWVLGAWLARRDSSYNAGAVTIAASATGRFAAVTIEHGERARDAACQFCALQCASVCSVGVCPIDADESVFRYGATNQCWTCPLAPSEQSGSPQRLVEPFSTTRDFSFCAAGASRSGVTKQEPTSAAVVTHELVVGEKTPTAPTLARQPAAARVRPVPAGKGTNVKSLLASAASFSTGSSRGNDVLRAQADKVVAQAKAAAEQAKALEEAAAKEVAASQAASASASGTSAAKESVASAVEAQAAQAAADKAKKALELAKLATEEVAKRYLAAYAELKVRQTALDSVATQLGAAENDQKAFAAAFASAQDKSAKLASKAKALGAEAEQSSAASARATSILEAAKAARESSASATVQAQVVLARLGDADATATAFMSHDVAQPLVGKAKESSDNGTASEMEEEEEDAESELEDS